MKKINYKKVLTAVLWMIVIAGLSASLAFVSKSEANIIAEDLSVIISNNEENLFLTEADVKKYLNDRNDQVLAHRYRNIQLSSLEKALNSHPAVENAEVSENISGEITLDIRQRTPVLRVINSSGESYYIDAQKKLMPLSENYSARVLVASGEIDEPFDRRYQWTVDQIAKNRTYSELSILDDLVAVNDVIYGDSLLSALIHQINVTKEGELELFPAIGNHKIVFGEAKDVQEKFNRLKLFYTEGLNKSDGWNKYAVVNLKYKNLVVCTKK